jgi:hypothetical protein
MPEFDLEVTTPTRVTTLAFDRTMTAKAEFYLSDNLLDRFNTRFYGLKLASVPVENKSALLEAALAFAAEDLDRGADSRIMRSFLTRSS